MRARRDASTREVWQSVAVACERLLLRVDPTHPWRGWLERAARAAANRLLELSA